MIILFDYFQDFVEFLTIFLINYCILEFIFLGYLDKFWDHCFCLDFTLIEFRFLSIVSIFQVVIHLNLANIFIQCVFILAYHRLFINRIVRFFLTVLKYCFFLFNDFIITSFHNSLTIVRDHWFVYFFYFLIILTIMSLYLIFGLKYLLILVKRGKILRFWNSNFDFRFLNVILLCFTIIMWPLKFRFLVIFHFFHLKFIEFKFKDLLF